METLDVIVGYIVAIGGVAGTVLMALAAFYQALGKKKAAKEAQDYAHAVESMARAIRDQHIRGNRQAAKEIAHEVQYRTQHEDSGLALDRILTERGLSVKPNTKED